MKDATLFEYLLVLPPSSSVTSDAKILKYQCKLEYGWKEPTKAKPHLTLANLVQPRYNEDKLINKYKQIAASTSPFHVHLSGFGKFTGITNTLYINVLNSSPITELVKEIRTFSRPVLKSIKNYSPIYSLVPHITIAKGISEPSFREAWPSWQTKIYTADSFTSEMVLLRRKVSTSLSKYEVVDSFSFQGLKPATQQLTLF